MNRGLWIARTRNESPSTSKGKTCDCFRIFMQDMPLVQPKTDDTYALAVGRPINMRLCLASITSSPGEIAPAKESPLGVPAKG